MPLSQNILSCHETINGNLHLVKSPLFPYAVNKNGSFDLVLNGFKPDTAINCSVTASNEIVSSPAPHTTQKGE